MHLMMDPAKDLITEASRSLVCRIRQWTSPLLGRPRAHSLAIKSLAGIPRGFVT